LNKESKL